MELKDLKELWPPLIAFGGLLGYVAMLGGAFKSLKMRTKDNTEAIKHLEAQMVTRDEISDKFKLIETKLNSHNRMLVLQIRHQQQSHEKLANLVEKLIKEK